MAYEHEHIDGCGSGCDHCHGEQEQDTSVVVGKLVASVLLVVAGFLSPKFFFTNEFVQPIIFACAYLIVGYDVFWHAIKNILHGKVFDENFLMTVSSIGAFVLGEWPEAVAVMWLYQLGEFLQDKATGSARKSISDLMDIRPDFARRINVDSSEEISPEKVHIGEIIEVLPGEKIPLDGIVISGSSSINESSLTGESVPKVVQLNDKVISGTINLEGVLHIRVTKSFEESTASKILDLVQNASNKKSKSENFIRKFAKIYTPIVCFLAVLVCVIPSIITSDWTTWINRALVFLVISCPCAIVISVPLTFFGGLGAASKGGVLIKGSNYLEALNNLETVVFDKTGTITKGQFSVNRIYPAETFTKDEVLRVAAYAESYSSHPIAKAILRTYGRQIDKSLIGNYKAITGKGISVYFDGAKAIVGNATLLSENGVIFNEYSGSGTLVYVAYDGIYLGTIVIKDKVKKTSKQAIAALKKLNVKNTVMLTGDSEETAKEVAREVNIDSYYSGLLPADKVEHVEELLTSSSKGGSLAFVGDGVNDAPVLARADVGVAMGALGSDAAIEAADVVLMNDDLMSLSQAIRIAKRTHKLSTQNIVFALTVKIVFMALGFLGIAGMWIAVFGDVGVCLLAIANSLRVLRR